MNYIGVNLIAVLVGAVANMVLGFLWYSKTFFGKEWIRLTGMKEGHSMDSQKMAKTYGISFIGGFVMIYVLAHFLKLAGAETAVAGAQGGFWAWLGFVATTGANEYLFAVQPKPWKLYWINQGYILVSLLVSGAILAIWR